MGELFVLEQSLQTWYNMEKECYISIHITYNMFSFPGGRIRLYSLWDILHKNDNVRQ